MIEYDVETPALRVNVYQYGRLIVRVLCESAEEAADVFAQYEDGDGIVCEVEGLASRHGPLDVLAPEPEDLTLEDEYRSGT